MPSDGSRPQHHKPTFGDSFQRGRIASLARTVRTDVFSASQLFQSERQSCHGTVPLVRRQILDVDIKVEVGELLVDGIPFPLQILVRIYDLIRLDRM